MKELCPPSFRPQPALTEQPPTQQPQDGGYLGLPTGAPIFLDLGSDRCGTPVPQPQGLGRGQTPHPHGGLPGCSPDCCHSRGRPTPDGPDSAARRPAEAMGSSAAWSEGAHGDTADRGTVVPACCLSRPSLAERPALGLGSDSAGRSVALQHQIGWPTEQPGLVPTPGVRRLGAQDSHLMGHS